jgi:hydrogenase nickel incorporation protein HypB
MCVTCGCGEGTPSIEGLTHQHGHLHTHHALDHPYRLRRRHASADDAAETRRVRIEEDILATNDGYARQNRAQLAACGVFALNLMSSPGAGKTTLLVSTIKALQGKLDISVIEGDQQTSLDAERIRAAGAPALQINTGKGCHLEAHGVGQALQQLPLAAGGVLMIENVGNLVCPAAFDLGEACKVVIFSVTEGEDKPIKYPDMFRAASLVLINKCDLLPYLDFDVDQAIAFARRVNPGLEVIKLSATSGEGLDEWLDWILRAVTAKTRPATDAIMVSAKKYRPVTA